MDALYQILRWQDAAPQATCPECKGKRQRCLPCRSTGKVPAHWVCADCGNWPEGCRCPRTRRKEYTTRLKPRPNARNNG